MTEEEQAAGLKPGPRRRILLWAATAVAMSVVLAAAFVFLPRNPVTTADVLASGTDLGELHVFKPDAPPKELVFLFSDLDGWTKDMTASAEGMVAEGAAVLGVDLPAYLKMLRANKDQDCHYLDSAIERMSKQLQQDIGMTSYRWPILAGVGAGGTVAYGAAAQAPDGTIAGALVVDPAPTLATRIPLCEGAPPTPAGKDGYSYGPLADMPGWLRLAERQDPDAMPWFAQIKDAKKITVDAGMAVSEVLASLLQPEVGSAAPSADGLPLVELPAAAKPRALAVILSGDGGWRDLDMQIGQMLASKDIGVVGWDTLRYFWTEKPPEQIAADLDKVICHYQTAWGVQDVLLVGYSFGADVLPAAINRMDPAIRSQVAQISLLGLARETAFEFHVASNWLGFGSNTQPIAPEAKQLDMAKVQCVYGEEETDSLCPDPLFAKAELIKTKGGHHFDGDDQALARRIIDGFDRRKANAA